MNTVRKNQRGFGPTELVVVIVVIVIMGTAGWLVYKDYKTKTPATAPTASSQYAGWKKYTDNNYDFSFLYPSDLTTSKDCGAVPCSGAAKTIGYSEVDVETALKVQPFTEPFVVFVPNFSTLTVQSVKSNLGSGFVAAYTSVYAGKVDGRDGVIVMLTHQADGTDYIEYAKNSKGQLLGFDVYGATGSKIYDSLN